MQIGVVFPQTEIGADPAAIRDFAQMADALGYEHVSAIDHVLGAAEPKGPPMARFYTRERMFHEPLTLFAYMAACTERVRLATAILILPQRQAVLVAKQAAEVDLLSGGRLTLGCGLGWNEVEYQALDVDFRTRARRFEEQIALMRRLWTERTVAFEGTFHTVEDAGLNPEPVQRPIPVWIGAFVEAAIERAGRIGDGWFTNPRLAPDDEGARTLDIVRRAVRAAGRDEAGFAINATVHLADGGIDGALAAAGKWRALGASHVTFRTIDAGLPDVQAHLDAIVAFAAAAGVGQAQSG